MSSPLLSILYEILSLPTLTFSTSQTSCLRHFFTVIPNPLLLSTFFSAERTFWIHIPHTFWILHLLPLCNHRNWKHTLHVNIFSARSIWPTFTDLKHLVSLLLRTFTHHFLLLHTSNEISYSNKIVHVIFITLLDAYSSKHHYQFTTIFWVSQLRRSGYKRCRSWSTLKIIGMEIVESSSFYVNIRVCVTVWSGCEWLVSSRCWIEEEFSDVSMVVECLYGSCGVRGEW